MQYLCWWTWNKYLNILNGVRSPLAPKPILYTMLCLLWLLVDSFKLANITDFMLSKVMYFICTKSKLLSCQPHSISCGLSSLSDLIDRLFATLGHLLASYWSTNHLEIIGLSTLSILSVICRALSWLVPCSTVLAMFLFCFYLWASLTCFVVFCLKESNSWPPLCCLVFFVCSLCLHCLCPYHYSLTHCILYVLYCHYLPLKFHLSCPHHLAHIWTVLLAVCHILIIFCQLIS